MNNDKTYVADEAKDKDTINLTENPTTPNTNTSGKCC